MAEWNGSSRLGRTRPLMVLNGIGMNLELIDGLAGALAQRRVISFDMPGVGRSPGPVVPYSAVTMAMTVSVVLDRLGIERADVLGISWGGGVAQQFALQHRTRIGRLVLAATSAGMIMAPGSAVALARLFDPAALTSGKTLHRTLAMMTNGGGRGAPVSLNAATPSSLTGWAYQIASLVGWSSVPLLPWLDVPTLIVAGDEDQVVPAWNARFLHALIPDSRLRLIEGAGHLFMLSHPREFVAELERFLDADVAVESA